MFGPKNFCILFFLKVPMKRFIVEKIDLEDILIYGGWKQKSKRKIVVVCRVWVFRLCSNEFF